MFFDNLQLTHVQGHLQQEDTYYPFGMGIAALSSKAANGLQNGYKYNGISEEDNFDLNLYDAYYRTLDPQLGRWWQTDPAGGKYSSVTGYNAAFNNPVNFADPWGDDPGWLIKLANNLLGGARLPEVVITASRPGGSGSDLLRSFVTDDFLNPRFVSSGFWQLIKRSNDELPYLQGQVPFSNIEWHTAPPETVSPYHPGLMDQWSESNSGFVRGTYEMADHVWINAQTLLLQPFKQYVQHLNGEVVNNNERVNAFVGTTTDVVTTVVGGKAVDEVLGPVMRRFIPKEISSAFRSFTRRNFRYNLGELTGEIPASAQAHHVFPQADEFSPFFKSRGINVHDPRFGSWWESTSHVKNAYQYNAQWRQFIRTNPNATTEDVMNFGKDIMRKYGLPVNY